MQESAGLDARGPARCALIWRRAEPAGQGMRLEVDRVVEVRQGVPHLAPERIGCYRRHARNRAPSRRTAVAWVKGVSGEV